MKKGDAVIFEDYYHNDLVFGIVVTTGRGNLEGRFEVMFTNRATETMYTFWTDREDLMSMDEWEEWGKEEYAAR